MNSFVFQHDANQKRLYFENIHVLHTLLFDEGLPVEFIPSDLLSLC